MNDWENGDHSFESSHSRDARSGDEKNHTFSTRAQRILVRVLLALRREGKCSRLGDARFEYDTSRAEALADRIMLEFPRRVLPIGFAALALLAIVVSLPLLRDALPSSGLVVADTTMTGALESGLRQSGTELNDGLETLKAIVVPFTTNDAPLEAPPPALPLEATAPFKAS